MAVGKTKNMVIMTGYVEGKASFHYYDNGKTVGNFVLKTFSKRKTEAGGYKSEPELTRCEVWSDVSPAMETDLEPGNLVSIVGYMRTTKYYDKNQKAWMPVTRVICTDLSFLCKSGK